MKAKLSLAIFTVLLFAGACSPGPDKPNDAPKDQAQDEPAPQSEPPASPPQAANAEEIYKTRCTMCHGESGKGDGAAAATLKPKPRDYTNAEWQKSVTDDQIRKTILEGGSAVGKSPAMPPQPDLQNQPEVVENLVKIIRGFAKP